MEIWILAFAVAFAVVIAIIYICCVYFLLQRKSEQPVKSRSPGLLLVMAVFNYSSTLSLCLVFVVLTIDTISLTSRAAFSLTLVAISEIAAMPVFMATYIAR